ncbi:MAG: helix-turn-helix domain-containing protein, partial [Deltaproteobacteria bacterium]|nr:helix-turn-helix domain-containing protein [Deltaproteobacteria bacterium]
MPRSSQILNAVEAAAYLRAHVETVRRLARRGAIPSFKIGKDWRFRREDLRAFVESASAKGDRRDSIDPRELTRKLRNEIRERRRVEASLRESEQRLLLIANNLPVGMIYQIIRESDGTRRFTFLSGAVERLHGCTAEEAIGDAARIYGTVLEDDRDRVIAEEELAL